jgi:DNA primase
LTLEHVKQLAPMVKTVVVNYDPDSAGVAATERSLATLLEENLDVCVLSLPGGLDPDDFVKQQGAEAYRKLVEHAPSFFDYLVERVPKMFDLGQPAGKAAAARRVLEYVNKLPDRIVRVEMANRLSDRLGLDRDLLGKELRTAAASRRDAKLSVPAASQVSQVERALLRYLISEPEGRSEVLPAVVRMLNEIPALSDLPTRNVFLALASMSGDDPISPVDVAALADRLADADSQKMALILQDEAVEPLTVDSAKSCAQDLARKPMAARIQELKGLIRQAEASGEVQEALRLLSEMKALEKRLAAKDLLTFPSDT